MDTNILALIVAFVIFVVGFGGLFIITKKLGYWNNDKSKLQMVKPEITKPKKAELISKKEWQKVLPMIKKNAVIFNKMDKATFTKIGGKPNLPEDIEWPTVEGDPMSFVAQVDLNDLPPEQIGNLKGAILVFAKLTDVDYLEPNFKNYKLIHIQNLSAPEREFPENLDNYDRFEPTYLTNFLFEGDIPQNITDEIDCLKYGTDHAPSIDNYFDMAENYYEGLPEAQLVKDKAIKIGGYGNFMQGGGLGEFPFIERNFKNSRLKECVHKLAEKDYVLFMQIFSEKDKEQKMLFGDAGIIYIYVKRSDLLAGKLENVVFDMQCG